MEEWFICGHFWEGRGKIVGNELPKSALAYGYFRAKKNGRDTNPPANPGSLAKFLFGRTVLGSLRASSLRA